MMPRSRVRDSSDGFRKALLDERAQMLWERRQSGPLAPIGGGDSADQAAAFQEQFVTLHRNDLQASKIRLVDAALARLDAGEFGRCLECDAAIAPARLRAVPWASYCVTCQQQRDLRDEEGRSRVA